jgi:hypothetical protein
MQGAVTQGAVVVVVAAGMVVLGPVTVVVGAILVVVHRGALREVDQMRLPAYASRTGARASFT